MTTIQNPIRILLVDDHRSFMDGLAMVINTRQAEMEIVGMVTSIEEVPLLAYEKKPDLIILDLDLRGTNSLDSLPALRTHTDAKILILTGLRDTTLFERAMELGANGILLKDEPAATILKAIEKVARGEIWASQEILGRLLNKLAKMRNNQGQNPENRKIAELTAREKEIIATLLSLDSSTNEDIAGHLYISQSTLKNHLTAIYSKLEVKNRLELMKYALNNRLNE